MVSQQEPTFLVDAYSDPIVLKICGRACYLNCAVLNEFLQGMLAKGRSNFVFDFSECLGMDSTVLGILAGIGIEVMKADPRGSVVLCKLSTRNLELVRNLGLHRILEVDSGDYPMHFGDQTVELTQPNKAKIASARDILKAHENLLCVDEGNHAKFQDVVIFLKEQIEDDTP
tara:strand:- start:45506 stop:46021 length:516 start_codon:yes stop_codon:yes gene_type:complete